MWVKTQCGVMWMATAMCVFSRLFIWGEVNIECTTPVMKKGVTKVVASLHCGHQMLWVTDGFGGWKQAIHQVCRDPLYTGKVGRPRLLVWPELYLVQVVKHKAGKRLVSMSQRFCFGSWLTAQQLLWHFQYGLH